MKIGDKVKIEITGVVGIFEAEVVGFDRCDPPCPHIKVHQKGWEGFTLKHGDYILKMKENK